MVGRSVGNARGSSSGDAGRLGDIRSKDDDRLALLEMGSIGLKIIFFKLGSCHGCKGPEAKNTAL